MKRSVGYYLFKTKTLRTKAGGRTMTSAASTIALNDIDRRTNKYKGMAGNF